MYLAYTVVHHPGQSKFHFRQTLKICWAREIILTWIPEHECLKYKKNVIAVWFHIFLFLLLLWKSSFECTESLLEKLARNGRDIYLANNPPNVYISSVQLENWWLKSELPTPSFVTPICADSWFWGYQHCKGCQEKQHFSWLSSTTFLVSPSKSRNLESSC